MKKIGFVALVGLPNAGKSSLLNAILKANLFISSRRPQSTQKIIRGIYNDKDSQIVFIDMPGINGQINKKVADVLKQVELILYLKPGNNDISSKDLNILKTIKQHKRKIAIISKIDIAIPEKVTNIDKVLQSFNFLKVTSTSIKKPPSITWLINLIKEILPKGNMLYSPNSLIDQEKNFIFEEMVREGLFKFLNQEVPYQTKVKITNIFKKKEKEIILIEGEILVTKDSHKKIIIGAKGKTIKLISTYARKKIESLINQRVFLNLKVRQK